MKKSLPIWFSITTSCGLIAFALIIYFFGKILLAGILLLFGVGVALRSLQRRKRQLD